MISAATFFLLSIATGQYIGPLPQNNCMNAAMALTPDGVVCREASAMTACPVPGMPGVYTSCPVFDLPKVTVKP